MGYLSTIVKYKKFFLSFIFFIIFFLAFFIKDVHIDSSIKKFFIKNDPDYLYYKKITNKFGSDNSFIIGINDKDIFTYEKLLLLKKLVSSLEELKGVSRVDSLFNQKNIIYKNGELYSDVFIDPDDIPKSPQKLEEIKKEALDNILINRNFISENGNLFLIKVTLENNDSSVFNLMMTNNLEKILENYKNKFESVKLFGTPYLSAQISEYILHDVVVTVVLGIIVIFIVIFYNLKSIKLTFIPITTSFLSIIATFGFMGLLNIPLSMLTAIVPTLIVLIGTTEDSYLISEYIEEKKNGNKDIILNVSKKLGLAIILTSFTTMIGFLSVYLNEIEILKDFALVSSFGIFINFLITIIIVPILLDKLRIDNISKKTLSYTKFLNLTISVFKFHTKEVYFLAFSLFLISLFFAQKIVVDNNTLNYFKKSSEVRKLADFFKSRTNGIQSFYIVLEAPKNRAFKKWKYLHELEKIENFIRSGKVKFNYSLSIADYLSLVNQEWHEGDKRFFHVPKNNFTIAQYYNFFHRKDIRRFVDTKYKIAKIEVYHNIFSSNEFNVQKKKLENFIKNNIDSSLKVVITGRNVLINKAADTISVGQLQSLIFTLFLVLVVIILVFKTINAGIVILIANIVPIVILFGIMGMFHIPLNVVTAIIATITYGVIVDDTIHIMMRYNYERSYFKDKNIALIHTLLGEGKAVILTSLSLVIGYFTLITSKFVPVIHFAILSILVIIVALFSDLFLVPALIKKLKVDKN